jgi:hypothetical protein
MMRLLLALLLLPGLAETGVAQTAPPISDDRTVPLGECLRLAVDALEGT